MTFTFLKCQGLASKYTNKLHSEEFINVFFKKAIVLLTETWTNELSDISVAGFKDFRLNRFNKKQNPKRDSGGIVLFVRDKLIINKHCILFKKDGDDIIWLKIDKHLFHLSSDLYLCLCNAIPSNSSREAFTEISILDRISQNIVQGPVVQN